ncbi:RDD family protein [Bacillus sp. PS06]|uniref:RDD family protein n=1 Tax=Bacillus sp. PS06 TaxID=2764176 RepID=UPI00177B7FAA|nr:RDD family protein [Bacillus sp. PS06]MBD8067677.1 RDD family protein [Bacillus sp. PS06]
MDQEKIDIKTPEYVSIQFQSAGLGSRASAFIIDQLILFIVNLLIVVLLFFVFLSQESLFFLGDISSGSIAIAIILVFLLNWGYYFAFEYFYGGRTPGKKMIGIRVIQENGHSITLLSSFIRNFLRIVDSLPTGHLLGMLMIFFHSKHKRIGDLVAGTIVVHERKEKQKRKRTPLEKEIELRGLSKDSLLLEDWVIKSLSAKEWNLVNTYCHRMLQLAPFDRKQLTKQVADIMFPKIGLEIDGRKDVELENILLALYLYLKEEWEFEL